MGSMFNKKGNVLGPNSKIGLDSNCRNCGRFFSKNTTYLEMSKHHEICKHESEKKKLEKLMKDLVKSNKELEEYEKISNTNKINKINSNNGNLKSNFDKLKNNNVTKDNISNNNQIVNIHNEDNYNIISIDNSNSIISNRMLNKNKKTNIKEKLKSNSVHKKIPFSNNLGNQVLDSKNKYSNKMVKQKSYKIDSNQFDRNISNLNSAYLKDFPFEEKLQQFKTYIQNLKIDWREGACTLELDRDNLLKQSIEQFNKIDPFKELHINFKGEISYDAGGIIREWFTVIFKELQKESLKLFEPSDTADFSYKIHSNTQSTLENLEIFNFVGKLISKALLDNMTINACFNKIIYKMVLDEQVTLDDLVFIDKPLYHSLKELLKVERVSELGLYFVVQYESLGQIVSYELISNGNNVIVTNDNLNDYIQKRIEHIQQKDRLFINEIKTGIYSLIPENLIKIFSADEFELLLNGQPFIDLMDWKVNTIYKGYNENSNVIINFWHILNDFSQEKLARFIQFCTGSSRIPLGGFSVLESNRGMISKFCITKTEWYKKNSNYIRAHTCFNRLDIPEFPTIELLEEAIGYIINNEILGFGVD